MSIVNIAQIRRAASTATTAFTPTATGVNIFVQTKVKMLKSTPLPCIPLKGKQCGTEQENKTEEEKLEGLHCRWKPRYLPIR